MFSVLRVHVSPSRCSMEVIKFCLINQSMKVVLLFWVLYFIIKSGNLMNV